MSRTVRAALAAAAAFAVASGIGIAASPTQAALPSPNGYVAAGQSNATRTVTGYQATAARYATNIEVMADYYETKNINFALSSLAVLGNKLASTNASFNATASQQTTGQSDKWTTYADGRINYSAALAQKYVADRNSDINRYLSNAQATAEPVLDYTSCTDVILYGIRGSGQLGNEQPFGFGRQAAAQAREIAKYLQSGAAGAKISVGYRADGYPALPVTAGVVPELLIASAQSGATVAVQDIKSISLTCPKSKIIMIGYSQGAGSAHLAAFDAGTDAAFAKSNLVGTVLIADPIRHAADPAVTQLLFNGTAAPFDGAFAGEFPTKVPGVLTGRVLNVCNVEDDACNWDPATKWVLDQQHTEAYFAPDVMSRVVAWTASVVK